jgi:hypothetical protein
MFSEFVFHNDVLYLGKHINLVKPLARFYYEHTLFHLWRRLSYLFSHPQWTFIWKSEDSWNLKHMSTEYIGTDSWNILTDGIYFMYANHDDNSLSADLNVGHIRLTTYRSATLRRMQDKYRICYYININGDYDIVLLVLLRSTDSDYTIDIFKL